MLDQIDIFNKMRSSPSFFVQTMFGMEEQKGRDGIFIKGRHITWQQAEILESVGRAANGQGPKRITIRSGHGIGKCQKKGEKVRMYDGTKKKVEDVVVGDKLMGPDSRPRTVLETHSGWDELYRVKMRDGGEYVVNSEHLLALKCSQTHGSHTAGEEVYVSVKDWLGWSNRRKRTHVGWRAGVEYDKKDVSIDPYILGVWLGDGTSCKSEITVPDEEIIREWEKDAHRRGMYLRQYKKYTYTMTTGEDFTGNNTFLKDLRKYNLLNKKHIPQEYMVNSRKNRLELLAGLIDSDGYINRTNTVVITQKRKELSYQIAELARSLGCRAKIKKRRRYCVYLGEKRWGTYYDVTISRNLEDLNLRVQRKAERINPTDRTSLHAGIDIERDGFGEYFGFTVDKDNLYLTEDYIVLHNSSCVSRVLLWYLFCFTDSQVACTAPNAHQMNDVLWKECSKRINKMPVSIQGQYEWTKSHIRMASSPNTWFARAKTARKEDSEALAGVHGEHVLLIADESSGVADENFETAEGALTEENYIMILISNPTRLEGYFYDSHQSPRREKLHYSSEDSPLVTTEYVQGWMDKYGADSDEYRIRVEGKFPRENLMDERGYVKLVNQEKINYTPNVELGAGEKVIGIDPAGAGRDTTRWICRDAGKMVVVAEERISSPKIIAQKTATLQMELQIPDGNIIYDNFGVGANVGVELAFLGIKAMGINVGDKADDAKRFVNKRAEYFWRFRERLEKGSELASSSKRKDLQRIKYKRELSGRIKIQPKLEIKKEHDGISPDVADAAMLTFAIDLESKNTIRQRKSKKKRYYRDPITYEWKEVRG